jgi:hypothetical protein
MANLGIHIPKRYVAEETADKKFHHAALVGEDEELASIERIDQLIPYVWVSSWDCATDMSMLKAKNIRFVLNMSPNRKDAPTVECMRKLGIIHEHIPVENVPDWKPEDTQIEAEVVTAGEDGIIVQKEKPVQILSLRDALPRTHGFIKRAFDQKKNILVHDDQGTSAAPAAVAYFLLKNFYAKQSPDANKLQLVLNRIKLKRPCVDINFGFLETLEDCESEWSGRAVIESQSLSVRRNKVLKEREKARIANTVTAERKQADDAWARQVKVGELGRVVRKKLI